MGQNILASPLARKVAKVKKIDLNMVKGSGPRGRITTKDIDSYLDNNNQPTQLAMRLKNSGVISPIFTFESVPMTGIRKATAKAMLNSHINNAAFTSFKKIDFTNVVNMRNDLKPTYQKLNIKLTYLAFLVKAVALALQEMPNINVQIDPENNAIKYIKNINISIAVDTPKGLFVPVIKSANYLSVFEIAQEIENLAIKARDGKLTPSEMKEGSFTISNFGSAGLEFATPIINSPEAAILGVGIMKKEPTYINDVIVPRFFMPLSLTADHRIIDGADSGRFLQKIEGYLSAPMMLFFKELEIA